MLSRRQKRAIVGTIAFGLFAAVILFAISRFFANRALERQLAEERASLVPPEPLIVTVARDTVTRQRTFAARAEPWTRATLATEVGGTVVRIGGELGTAVPAGEVLLELDDAAARATAQGAQIQADEAARRQRELEQLLRTEAVASTDAAAIASTAAAAAQEARRASVLLEKHRLRAPFAGKIQGRQVEVGDMLAPGQPAFELVDTSRLRIVLYAGETEVSSFAPGADIELRYPALGGQTGRAVVRHVAPAAGPNGLFRIEAEQANDASRVPGGIAAMVTAPVRHYTNTLFIPAAAVRIEGARAVVQRMRPDGGSEAVVVEIGPELDGRFPLFAGLAEGDRIIIR